MSAGSNDFEALDARLDRVEAILGLQRMSAQRDADIGGASHQSRSCGGASGLSLGCHCIEETLPE